MNSCPFCAQRLVDFYGDPAGPIVVAEKPSDEAYQAGRLWQDKCADIWTRELMQLGMSSHRLYFVSMWQHPPLKECNLQWHQSKLDEILSTASCALFLGAVVCKRYLGHSPGNILGVKMQSEIHKNLQVAMAAPAIESLLTPAGSVGDLRIALSRFMEETRKIYPNY